MHHSAGQDTSSGEFVDVNGGDVLVRRWDDALETFAQGSGVSGAPPRRHRMFDGAHSCPGAGA